MSPTLRRSLLALTTVLAAACRDGTPTGPAVAPLEVAPALSSAREGEPIPGRYIVVFRDDVADVPGLARQLVSTHGGTLGFVYRYALRGFSAALSAQAAEALARNPVVALVEQDQVVTAIATQNGATWGLDRIDQRSRPLSTTYTYNVTGAGVHAYIIDTGIRLTHADFGGRAVTGYDAITSGGTATDCHGHGTHVAGTVGGTTWGVAKGVTLHAVRVLDCGGSGSNAGVIAGVDWVTGNHVKPAVANMSLGGGASSTLDAAVSNSIAAGVSYAIAAGNGNIFGMQANACNYSPARVAAAITVSATNSSDAKASWANYGSCVDFFAPGVSITSAWYSSDGATNTISGTSMATPHVAGAAALYLEANPNASPATVRNALYDMTTKGIVTSSSTTNNHLLYTLDIGAGGGGGGGNTPPTAAFTQSCTNLTCTFTNTSTDAGGSIASSSWTFGDGSSSTAPSPSHTYAAAGNYTVTLTVTDNEGATDTETRTVSVSAPPSGLTLSGSYRKQKGWVYVDLVWSPTGTGNVDVKRNGTLHVTTTNDGAYTDNTGVKGGGSFTYQVCLAGSSTCSNVITVTF